MALPSSNTCLLGKGNPYTLSPPKTLYRPYSPNPNAAPDPITSTKPLSPALLTYRTTSPSPATTPYTPTHPTTSHGDLSYPPSLLHTTPLPSHLPYNIPQHLKLPSPPTTHGPTPPPNPTLTKTHSAFYLSNAHTAPALATQNALRDLTATARAFPTLASDPTVHLAAATYYALLCATSDAIDSTPDPARARLALAESITVLQRTEPTYDWRDAFHAPAAFGGRDEEVVPGYAKLFVDQVRRVLDRGVYARLVEGIIDVWQAMSLETTFGATGEVDERTYLATRARTVGLGPFFVLVEAVVGGDGGRVEEEVKMQVAVAVALQNDVLGLSRDLEMGEGRNFVVVCSRGAGRGLAWGVEKAVVVHNEAVGEAVEVWRGRGREGREGREGEGEVMAEVVGFVGRHWGWVAGRYM